MMTSVAPVAGKLRTYPAYFTAAGIDTFEPTSSAAGYWGEGLLSGPAVAGLAAHTLFDHAGPFGTAMVTALANPAARIDFAEGTDVDAPGSELFSHA